MGSTDKKITTYDAFISYRHLPLDMYVAKTLHRTLESFVLPKHLRKEGEKIKIERVFRDQDELPLSNNLSEPIELAIKGSEYLIVICSPQLKESEWCRREIEGFKALHGQSRIFAVLIDGEPQDSFPVEILTEEYETLDETGNTVIRQRNVEPLAADVRGKNRRQIKKKIKEESLRILAPMFGVTYDDLKQRHRECKLRRALIIASAISVILLGFGVISTSMAIQINNQSREIKAGYSEALAKESQNVLGRGLREEALEIANEAISMQDNAVSRAALCRVEGTFAPEGMLMPEYAAKIGTGIYGMVLSPDGKNLAICDNLGRLHLMDTRTGRLSDISSKQAVVTAGDGQILFLDDNRLLYNDNGTSRVHYIDENDEIEIAYDFGSFYFDSERKRLYYVSEYGLYVLDSDSLELLMEIGIDVDYNSKVCVSPDGKRIMVTSAIYDNYAGGIYILDAVSGEIIAYNDNLGGMVVDIAASADCFYEDVTNISDDADASTSYIAAIDGRTAEVLWQSEPSVAVYANVDYMENAGRGYLFNYSVSGLMSINPRTGQVLHSPTTYSTLMATTKGEDKGKYYAISYDADIIEYDVTTGTSDVFNTYVEKPNMKIRDAIITKDGCYLYFEGADYLVGYKPFKGENREYVGDDVSEYQDRNGYVCFADSVYNMYYAGDDMDVADDELYSIKYRSRDKEYYLAYDVFGDGIRIYNDGGKRPIGEIDVNTGFITAPFFSEDKRYVGVPSQNGDLSIYDMEEFELVTTLSNDFIYVNCMQPINNGYIIDSMYYDYIVDNEFNVIWRMEKAAGYQYMGYNEKTGCIVALCRDEIYEIPINW